VIRAVIFDLDGVLIDSEQLWDEVRREVAREYRDDGVPWPEGATAAMQGMSAPEWSVYMVEKLGVDLDARAVDHVVVGKILRRYEQHLPLIPGAVEAVRRMGEHWPLALATSSNREVIDTVLSVTGLAEVFNVTVSSEEVARGKPAPDVYLEAASRLGETPEHCAAVEDSANGIRSALAARVQVVAIPNEHYPPPPEVLATAAVVLATIGELTPGVLDGIGGAVHEHREEHLDDQELDSFPASDPHSDWAGPPA
jgi:HAD superfamily hydrolase (TIGR01509 family)